jgi:hypothetical protein
MGEKQAVRSEAHKPKLALTELAQQQSVALNIATAHKSTYLGRMSLKRSSNSRTHS